jgi:hypothetical protein
MWRTLVIATALLGGCAPSGTKLDIRDTEAFVPYARLSLGQPGELRRGTAFELGVAQTHARSSQTLPAGESSALRSGTFSGPRELSNEVRATVVDAAARFRSSGAENLWVEGLLGLGYAELAYTVSSGNRHVSDDATQLGVLGGIGMVWRVLPGTSAQARLTLLNGMGIEDDTDVDRWEIAVAQAIGRHAELRAGYMWWDIKTTRHRLSDVRSRISGPALGFALSF